MKISQQIILCVVSLTMLSCSSNQSEIMKKDSTIFGKGSSLTTNFSGQAWIQYLSSDAHFDCSVYNVTFEAGVRNDWHVHSIGQILLCTDGQGYYQQKGSPAQKLSAGSVVEIPAGVEHWHGATADSSFTHIGITPRASENKAQWLALVTDLEYEQASK